MSLKKEKLDSMEKYRLLFKNSLNGIVFHEIVYDSEHNPVNYNITDVNPMYEAILSIKREDVLNKLATDVYGVENPPYLEIYAKVADTLEPTSFTSFFEPMNKHFKISAFSFEKGKFITVFEDITEQLEAGRIIAESEEKYRNMINNLDAGYFIVGIDGSILYHNRAFNKIAGYDVSEDLIGLRMPNLWQNPKERERYLEQLMKNGYINNYIINAIDKDGNKIVLQAYAHLVKDNNNNPVSIEATFMDITEKYELEQKLIESERDLRIINEQLEEKVIDRTKALRKSEKKYRILFEKSPFFIGILNQQGILIEASEGVEDFLTKHTKSDMIGKSFIDIFSLNEKNRYLIPIFRDYLENILKGKSEDPVEFQLHQATGGFLWCTIDSTLVKLEDEVIIQILMINISDRKEAEQKLRESEEKYRILFETAPDGAALTTMDGSFLEVNPAFQKMLGYSVDELNLLKYQELTPEKWHKIEADKIQEIMDIGHGTLEKEFIRKDGTLLPISLTGWLIKDKEGIPTKLGAYVEDITERKQAEEKLKESEEKYRNIVENSLDGINLTNEQGNLIEWNQGMEDITGLKRDEVLGRPVWEVQFLLTTETDRAPEMKELLKNSILNILKMGDLPLPTQVREQKINCRDGSHKIVQTNSYSFKTDLGKMIGTIMRDISKQKEAEQELKEHSTKMDVLNRIIIASNKAENISTLIEEILDSILELMSLDGGGAYLINETAQKAELIYQKGLPSDFLKFFGDVRIEDETFKSVLVEGKMKMVENLPILNPSMAKITGLCSIISIPLFSKDKIIGALNIGSKKRYAFSELEKEILKSLSREIGTAISKMQSEGALRKSETRYREAYNRAEIYKDIFAHDISNILQSVLTSVELNYQHQEEFRFKNERIENLDIIKEQVNYGANLVSNVRKLSQLEEIPLNSQNIEFNKVIESAIEFIKRKFSYKDINIKIENQYQRYDVKANQFLQQVFENLLMNAVKHNEQSPIEIFIKIAKEMKEENQFLRVEFIDNGIGVEDVRKNEIFQREIRDDRSVSGIGLGLLLTRKIIKSYNGEIWVEDRIKGDHSKGSKFIIMIPMTE